MMRVDRSCSLVPQDGSNGYACSSINADGFKKKKRGGSRGDKDLRDSSQFLSARTQR